MATFARPEGYEEEPWLWERGNAGFYGGITHGGAGGSWKKGYGPGTESYKDYWAKVKETRAAGHIPPGGIKELTVSQKWYRDTVLSRGKPGGGGSPPAPPTESPTAPPTGQTTAPPPNVGGAPQPWDEGVQSIWDDPRSAWLEEQEMGGFNAADYRTGGKLNTPEEFAKLTRAQQEIVQRPENTFQQAGPGGTTATGGTRPPPSPTGGGSGLDESVGSYLLEQVGYTQEQIDNLTPAQIQEMNNWGGTNKRVTDWAAGDTLAEANAHLSQEMNDYRLRRIDERWATDRTRWGRDRQGTIDRGVNFTDYNPFSGSEWGKYDTLEDMQTYNQNKPRDDRNFPCFVAGTKVAVSNKGTKNIEDVEVGDLVACYDTISDTLEESAVTHTFTHPDTDGYLVVNESLGVTPNHEIYTGTGWVSAGNLEVGDNIQMIGGGLTKVSNIEKVDKSVTTHNLEVANRHNYYADGVLVHNKTMVPPSPEEKARNDEWRRNNPQPPRTPLKMPPGGLQRGNPNRPPPNPMGGGAIPQYAPPGSGGGRRPPPNPMGGGLRTGYMRR